MTDFWNMIDLGRCCLNFYYSIGKILFLQSAVYKAGTEDVPEYYDYLLAILTFLVWFRILSLLRLFQKTRALIRLILEVCKDMYAFVIVLTIALVGFAITYGILLDGEESKNFSSQINHTFLLMNGDFNYDDYTKPLWVMFVIATVFMPLIMLNLLIAIMGDTFERVNSVMIEADGRELNALILEQENMMFWNRKVYKKEILHWGFQTEGISGTVWEGKVKAFQSALVKMQDNTDKVIQSDSNQQFELLTRVSDKLNSMEKQINMRLKRLEDNILQSAGG